MFQIHYRTASGKMVILYPKSEGEIERALRRLAYRHIDSELRVSTQGTRRCGGTEAIDPALPDSKYTWYYERGPVEMRL